MQKQTQKYAQNVKHANFDHALPPCRGAPKRSRSKKLERYLQLRGAVLKVVMEVLFAAS